MNRNSPIEHREPETERGKLIRSLREKQNLSIEELARILRTKPRYVRWLEIRKNEKMKVGTAEQLAQAFDIKTSAFKDFLDLARLETKTAIGRRVRSQRRKLYLTQTQLAEKIGKTRAYISAIESGKVHLRYARGTRHLLAEALQLDPVALDNAVSRKKKRGKTKPEAHQFQI